MGCGVYPRAGSAAVKNCGVISQTLDRRTMAYSERFSEAGAHLIWHDTTAWGIQHSSERRRGRFAARTMILLAPFVVLALAPAAASAAKTIAVQLSPATIVADGASTSVATATVRNGDSAVTGDQVKFSSSVGQSISGTTSHRDGTYTATITSTRTAGPAVITATDTTSKRDISAQATLTQVAGQVARPAERIAVQLSPSTIPADGASTSTATAVVTGARGAIVFSTSDPGIRVARTTSRGNGVYTTTLTSSTTPGIKTVVARDSGSGAQGTATLTSVALGSTVTLSTVPAAPLTNQLVTLVAIVTVAGGSTPAGTITFLNHGAPIGGCAGLPVATQVSQRLSEAACQARFAASGSPEQLAATFTSSSPNVAAASAAATLTVGQGATSTSLDVSNPSVGVGSTATYTAQIGAADSGPVLPTGSVDFFDGGQRIPSCSGVRLATAGGLATATCTVSYGRSGQHRITAQYYGDANFTGSASSPAQPVNVNSLPPRVLGRIKAVMQWAFYYTPKYTQILALTVKRAPVGASVAVTCRGAGCPYAKRVDRVRRGKVCKPSRRHRCPAAETVNLMRGFQHRRLTIGSRVIVKITRAHWVGKYYLFGVRSGRPPSIRISCLAPGRTRPGVGC
jgi:hypothetical protein